jgi:hypothetical protein
MCAAKGHVRFTPNSGHCAIHSITSSARNRMDDKFLQEPQLISGHMRCNKPCPLYTQ